MKSPLTTFLFVCFVFTQIVYANPSSHPESILDVKFYNLSCKVDTALKRLAGVAHIHCISNTDTWNLKFDLSNQMKVYKLLVNGKQMPFSFNGGEISIDLTEPVKRNRETLISILFGGAPPQIGELDFIGSGIYWGKENELPSVLLHQQLGAESWWPCINQHYDQADSMRFSIELPQGLVPICNGQLASQERLPGNFVRHTWDIMDPLSAHEFACAIGDYRMIKESYKDQKGNSNSIFGILRSQELNETQQILQSAITTIKYFEEELGEIPDRIAGLKLVQSNLPGLSWSNLVSFELKRSNFAENQAFITRSIAYQWYGAKVSPASPEDQWLIEAIAGAWGLLPMENDPNSLRVEKYLKTFSMHPENQSIQDVDDLGVEVNANYGIQVFYTLKRLMGNDGAYKDLLKQVLVEFNQEAISEEKFIDFLLKSLGPRYRPYVMQYFKHKRLPVFQYKKISDGRSLSWEYRLMGCVEGIILPVAISVDGFNKELMATDTWQDINFVGGANKNILMDSRTELYILHENLK